MGDAARVVKIGAAYYAEDAFVAAMTDVASDRIDRALSGATTERQVGRALAGMRTSRAHEAALREALSRVVRASVGAADVPSGAAVVACFPAPGGSA